MIVALLSVRPRVLMTRSAHAQIIEENSTSRLLK
jgi:hypothetical protein